KMCWPRPVIDSPLRSGSTFQLHMNAFVQTMTITNLRMPPTSSDFNSTESGCIQNGGMPTVKFMVTSYSMQMNARLIAIFQPTMKGEIFRPRLFNGTDSRLYFRLCSG